MILFVLKINMAITVVLYIKYTDLRNFCVDRKYKKMSLNRFFDTKQLICYNKTAKSIKGGNQIEKRKHSP